MCISRGNGSRPYVEFGFHSVKSFMFMSIRCVCVCLFLCVLRSVSPGSDVERPVDLQDSLDVQRLLSQPCPVGPTQEHRVSSHNCLANERQKTLKKMADSTPTTNPFYKSSRDESSFYVSLFWQLGGRRRFLRQRWRQSLRPVFEKAQRVLLGRAHRTKHPNTGEEIK